MSKNVQNQNLLNSPIIDGNIIPDVDNAYDVGASAERFRNAYFAGTIYGNITPTGLTSNAIVQTNGSGQLTASNTIPETLSFTNTSKYEHYYDTSGVLAFSVYPSNGGTSLGWLDEKNSKLLLQLNPNVGVVTPYVSTSGLGTSSNIQINTTGTPGLNLQPGGTGNGLSLVVSGNPGQASLVHLPDPGTTSAANIIYDVSSQTLSGAKTFTNFTYFNNQIVCSASGAILLTNATPQIEFQPGATGHFLKLTAASPTSDQLVTFQDPGTSVNVIYDGLVQNFTAQKVFLKGPIFGDSTNQFSIAPSNGATMYTITAAAPFASRMLTVEDMGTDCTFVMHDSTFAQNLNGLFSFTNTRQTSNTTGVVFSLVANGGVPANSYMPIYLAEQQSGSSKRTGIQMGTTWQIGVDPNDSGTRDMFFYNLHSTNTPLNFAYTDGTITVGTGLVKSSSAISSNVTLDQTYSGKILQVSTAASSYTITLQNASSLAAGFEHTFSFTNVSGVGNVTIYCATIHGIYGFQFESGSSPTAHYQKQQVVFIQSALSVGDRAVFRCDGTSWTGEVYTSGACQTWS